MEKSRSIFDYPPLSRPAGQLGFSRVLLAGMVALVLVTVAACGSGGAGHGSVNYTVTSPLVPPQVPPYTGPLISGKDFGLEMKRGNLKVHNDTPTALQLLLSGEVDVTSGAFLSILQARAKQSQLRAFCPEQSTTNAVLVSTNPDVTKLADLKAKSVRVLTESPGGPNDYFMNEAFKAAGVKLTVQDLPNTRIVENMEQRFTTLSAGNADVGVVWNYNVADLKKTVGGKKVSVLTDFTDYPSIYLAYVSTTKWLEENPDEAAAFCASVLKTNRVLTTNFGAYQDAIDKYVEGNPPGRQVKMTWQAANKSSMWPHKGGLEPERVKPLLKMARDNGQIDKPLTYGDVVDDTAFKAALKLLAKDS